MEENALPKDERPRFPYAKFVIAVVVTIVVGLAGGMVAGQVRSGSRAGPAQATEVSGSFLDSTARTRASDEVDALDAKESKASSTAAQSSTEKESILPRSAPMPETPAVVPDEGSALL